MPRLPEPRFAPDCTIEVDGTPVAARTGESIAAALVAAGRFVLGRSAKYHRARGPFCLAGSCHSCIARVDGVPNQRTCQIPVRAGASVSTQNAFPTAGQDVLAAVDHVYPKHLDHHHLMTWSALANRAAVSLSRRLAGAGTLPDAVPAPALAPAEDRFEAVVIGSGPAGLSAAEALAAARRRVLLVESDGVLGGRLRCGTARVGAPPPSWPAEAVRTIRSAGGEAATRHTAIGIWNEGGSPLVLVRDDAHGPRLRLVRARSIIVATGTHAVPPAFPCNDLPGIFAGRAVARLLAEDGVVPGWRCVVGGDAERPAIAQALRAAGVEVVEAEHLARAVGGKRLRSVVLQDGRRIRCDALVWCGPRAPAWDLFRAAGGELEQEPQGAWRVRASEGGATAVRGLRVVGEVVAPMTVAAAIEAGRRTGEAAHGD